MPRTATLGNGCSRPDPVLGAARRNVPGPDIRACYAIGYRQATAPSPVALFRDESTRFVAAYLT